MSTPPTLQSSPVAARADNAPVAGLPEKIVVAGPQAAPDLMSRPARRSQRELLLNIIQAYKPWLVRAYCRVRFTIIRQDFLNEIGQYLPEEGKILDIGCGFGLFGLYFAGTGPKRRLFAYDLSAKRIAMARLAARTAEIPNARFEHGDAVKLALDDEYDAIYALDLIHHLPADKVPAFLSELHRALRPGGVLLIKDVDRRPFYKRWFTLWLDRLMVGLREPIRYWSREELRAMLRDAGFRVHSHTMRDVLPYPHILHICRKP